MISHVTLGSNDIGRSRAFYDRTLEPLGIGRVRDGAEAMAYAMTESAMPRLWVLAPFDGAPASFGNGTHVAFLAPSRAAVRAVHAAGLAAGGSDEGAPGPRPRYGAHYYGAYLRDPDGNKLQAVCYDPE